MKGANLAWYPAILCFVLPGKMGASVALAILSVAGGFVPYLGVYQIIRLFWSGRQAGREFYSGAAYVWPAMPSRWRVMPCPPCWPMCPPIRFWRACAFGRQTGSWGAPLGEVESRPIGSMKSTIVDRIEDIEPPLAHMIPELSSNILLPLVVVIAMFLIDWRMGLALLVTIPVALIPMAFGMRSYNKNYAAYMEANAHVNSVIVEYVEGIQVVKAFSQGERSYQKFARAVSSLRILP